MTDVKPRYAVRFTDRRTKRSVTVEADNMHEVSELVVAIAIAIHGEKPPAAPDVPAPRATP